MITGGRFPALRRAGMMMQMRSTSTSSVGISHQGVQLYGVGSAVLVLGVWGVGS